MTHLLRSRSVLGAAFLLALASCGDDSSGGQTGGSGGSTTGGAGGTGGRAGGSGGSTTTGGSGGSTATGGSGGATTTGGSGGSTAGAGGRGGSGGAGGAAAGGQGGSAGAGGAPAGGAGGRGAADAGADAAPSTDAGGVARMSFFVTSTGSGMVGGNLGGLMGADSKCTMLAKAVGSPKNQWVAYLSVASGPGGMPVHARSRIGSGPWFNARGEMFAASVDALHPMIDATAMRAAYIAAKPRDELFLDEKGQRVPPLEHDILTGSNGQGMLQMGATCMDWTSNMGGMAQVGHSDTPMGYSPSWNSAHTVNGCSAQSFVGPGGSGRLYCFATD